jgi:hypothetical protein
MALPDLSAFAATRPFSAAARSASALSACAFIFSAAALASLGRCAVATNERDSPRADIIARCISLSTPSSCPRIALLR